MPEHLVTHLQRADPLVRLAEGDLDVHDVLGLGERELDLAGAFALHKLRGARPPRLDVVEDAVTGEGRRAAIASFLATANQTVAPAGAVVVSGGRHADIGLGADLDGAVDSREGLLVGLDEDEHLRWLKMQYRQAFQPPGEERQLPGW